MRFKLQCHIGGKYLDRTNLTPIKFLRALKEIHDLDCAHIIDKWEEPLVRDWGNIHIPVGFFLKQEYAKI